MCLRLLCTSSISQVVMVRDHVQLRVFAVDKVLIGSSDVVLPLYACYHVF